jgi:hypothetical protein
MSNQLRAGCIPRLGDLQRSRHKRAHSFDENSLAYQTASGKQIQTFVHDWKRLHIPGRNASYAAANDLASLLGKKQSWLGHNPPLASLTLDSRNKAKFEGDHIERPNEL